MTSYKSSTAAICLYAYKILSTHQPAYLRSLLFPYEPTWAVRSSSQQLLNVPTVTTDFGRRAFSYCAPKIWNEIPAAIRNAPTVQTYKPTCLVLRTILKHDPTSHLATARASDSVIYSDIARVISLRIIITIIIIFNHFRDIRKYWSEISVFRRFYPTPVSFRAM